MVCWTPVYIQQVFLFGNNGNNNGNNISLQKEQMFDMAFLL